MEFEELVVGTIQRLSLLTKREEFYAKLEYCKQGYREAASQNDIAGMIDNLGLAREIKDQIAEDLASSGGRKRC